MYLNQYECLLKTNIYYLSEQLNEIQEIRKDIKYRTLGRIEYDYGTGHVYKSATSMEKCVQDLEGLDNRERKLIKRIDRAKTLNREVLQSYSDTERNHIIKCMVDQARGTPIIDDTLYQDYANKMYLHLERDDHINEMDPTNTVGKKADYTHDGLYPVTYKTITKTDYPISSFVLGNKERAYAYIY